MRVHELAKEFGISSSKLIEEIKGYGIEVKSHLSGLDDDRVSDIRHKHTVAQVAIKLENELQERKKEETVVEEDEWEFIDSEEVDELLVPDVEEESDELVLTESDLDEESFDEYKDEDAPDDPPHSKFFPKETEDEWSKREQVLENLREKSKENVASQEVIVEKPKGFWGWLKSLFS
jgi:translation initiation factor IF-2